MNKNNLIRLGVLACNMFQIKEDFEIIEYPSDSPSKVKVAISMSLSTFAHGPAQPVDFDFIELQTVGAPGTGEFARIGYSSRAKVLAIAFL